MSWKELRDSGLNFRLIESQEKLKRCLPQDKHRFQLARFPLRNQLDCFSSPTEGLTAATLSLPQIFRKIQIAR